MEPRKITLAALLILGLGFVPLHSAMAAKRLGLHVTQEELDIWRQRAANGPYKRRGDVSTNSPGDWELILSKANEFLGNPTNELWAGQTETTCWLPEGTPALPGRRRGERIRDAAFVYLLKGNSTYRDAVRTQLLAQAAKPGTNFADTSRWCLSPEGYKNGIGDGHSHEIVMWLTKIIFAYDYVRSSLSASDRTTLDTWFLHAGTFWGENNNKGLKSVFPNRNEDDYTTMGPGWHPDNTKCTFIKCITHFGGWDMCNFHESWNNRSASQMRFVAIAGILVDDSYIKGLAKRYFKEWLRFAVFPDGTDTDFRRWQDTAPTLGWNYAGGMIGAMVVMADHFARAGDPELYEHTTSEGIGRMTPAGGPKSLKQVVTLYMQHVNHTVVRYGTDDPTKNGNPNYLIDSVDELSNSRGVHDAWLSPANIFYQDNFIKSIYMRTASGAPAYPSAPATGGFNAWGGEQGIYPGVLFMFGQMEDKVWPYPLPGGDSVPPSPPKGLRIQ